jgi:hypothetical protein
MMRVCRIRRVLLVLAAGALISGGVSGCATARGGSDGTNDVGQGSRLSSIHERMTAAMTREGEIYHPVITSVASQGSLTITTTTELWIDTAGGRARANTVAQFSPTNSKSIEVVLDGERWYQTVEFGETLLREATACRDAASVTLSLMLGCHTRDERNLTVPVEDQTFGGRPAVALVTFAQVVGAQEAASYTDTLFVDAATYLPIAAQSGGTLRPHPGAAGVEVRSGQFTTYVHGFVDIDSVAAEVFDPTDIGYAETDPVTPLLKPSPDFTYYWLGADVDRQGLPRLVLRDTFIADTTERPALRYRAVLKYRAEADEFSDTLVELQEWRRDEWDFLATNGLLQREEGRCVRLIEVDIGERGEATIYATYGAAGDEGGCPTGRVDRYYALVRTAGAVVRISAPGATEWNSEMGMRALVGAIEAVE